MIYSSSNLKTPSKLCSGSKSHDVQEVLKKKQVTASVLLSFKRKGSIEFFFFFNKFIYFLFFYFWLRWVFVAVCGLSLVAESRGFSLSRCVGFSSRWLLLWSTGSRHTGFSRCGTQSSVAVARGL